MTQALQILTPGTDDRLGGVERFVASLDEALSGAWEVSAVAGRSRPPRALAKVGGQHLWMSRATTRYARHQHPDLIISNGTLGWGAPLSVPRIHVFHGTMPASAWANDRLPLRERVRSAVGGGAAEGLAGIGAVRVAVSDAVAREVKRSFGYGVHHVIENGVDSQIFYPREKADARARMGWPADQRIALFVGRAEPRKGSAVALTSTKAAGFTLAVAGPREVTGAWNLGLLNGQQLSWAYAGADCVLFPTRYEGCSYVLLEAIACARPVFTRKTGWARTLVDLVPEYERLMVCESDQYLVETLRQFEAADFDPAVKKARVVVSQRNSIGGWREKWRDLTRTVYEQRSNRRRAA